MVSSTETPTFLIHSLALSAAADLRRACILGFENVRFTILMVWTAIRKVMNKFLVFIFFAAAICADCFVVSAHAQRISVMDETRVKGTIRDIQPGLISINTQDGEAITCKIQDKDERAISIGGTPMRMPAKISVTGELPTSLLEKGMVVAFTIKAAKNGKPDGEIKRLRVLADQSAELKYDLLESTESETGGTIEVIGRVTERRNQRLKMQVPKTKWSKREKITCKLADDSKMLFAGDDLNRVMPGDEVSQMLVLELSNGERVVREVNIRLTADREEVTTAFHDKLEQQFSHLSDEPGVPRELRSANYVLYTDLSEQSAQILLAKLETMHELIGGYYGKRPRIPIECYVISNLRQWQGQELHPAGVAKIREQAGITLTARHVASGQAKAVVYCCEKHSIVQHEAVHAFCAQAFGSPGPVWYSEGMAEMGQYWKPDEPSVNIDPVVIDYLTNAQPKKMRDIVAAGQITGDSWQAYAWRWALCHLLANNPNYARRFKKLGLNIMSGGEDSFDKAFGNVADNISFEYDQFVQNFGNGYRVDLCAWNWRVADSNLSSNGRIKTEIDSQLGWQPTKLEAREGVSYDYAAQGTWKTSTTEETVSADGHDSGRGRLIGAILHDFQLSEPIELGKRGSFVPPVTGQLYLRCRDNWTELADNEGEITVHLRRTKKEMPKNKASTESAK